MPAYNEEDIIENSVSEWYGEVIRKTPGSEMIVVDDCSTDATSRILDDLALRLPGLRVVRPPRNAGHGKALRLGFQHVTGDYVFQTDSDRQFLPAEFWSLWNQKENYDFVFGVRSTRADGAFRLLITGCMRFLNFVLWGCWIVDANCPFKLMNRDSLEKVLSKIPSDTFIPMVMVSILAHKMAFRILDIKVTHLPRTGGQQSLKGMLKWLRVCSQCCMQLLRLRISLRSS